MADEEHGDDIEMESLPDMSNFDYDLEYLVRTRHRRSIGINREQLNEATFERGFAPAKKLPIKSRLKNLMVPPEPIRSSLRPPWSRAEWLEFLLVHLPILRWVWSYRPKFLTGDIISGVTVAIMHIPQGLAYALLANLPPVYGLYASVVPVIIYSIFGTSRHISVGTFAVVELMIANAIERVLSAHSLSDCIDTGDGGTNTTDLMAFNMTIDDCEREKVSIAITLACISGVLMVAMGLFQLGFVTIFLSDPLVSGYTTGAAVHVFTSQLRHITGIEPVASPGLFRVPRIWLSTLEKIATINWATVIISIISIAVLIVLRVVNLRLQKVRVPFPTYSKKEHRWRTTKIIWPVPIPAQLLVVIVGTIVSFSANLETRYDVTVVGDIPIGAPPVSAPKGKYVLDVLQDAFVISIVTFSVTISLAQVFARKFNYTIHSNQEFVAYGVMNVVGSFFSSFTAAGSLSRSLVQANSGGKTQLVGLVSSVIILIVLVALGGLFEPLPRAVLASVVWVALYGMFLQTKDIWKYFKLSFPDMCVWLVVFFATVLLGVDLGLGVGVGFSLLLIIIRTILPYSSVLGRARNTEIYRNMDNFEKVENVPGVLIFRFQAPLCFINSKVFRTRLEMVTQVDCKAITENLKAEKEGCIQHLCTTHCVRRRGSYKPPQPGGQSTTYQTTSLSRTFSFEQAVTNDITNEDHMTSHEQHPVRQRNVHVHVDTERPHTVIVDCGPIGFMDAVGVKTLQQVVMDFDLCKVQVILAAMTKENRDMMERAGFFERCGKEWLFPSIQDAVHHAKFGTKLHPASQKEDSDSVGQQEEEEGEGRDSPDNQHRQLNAAQEEPSNHNNNNSEVPAVSGDTEVPIEMLDPSHSD